MSIGSEKQLDTEFHLYASKQGFVLSLFGYLFALAALLQLVFDPSHLFNRWMWALIGPSVAFQAVKIAREKHPASQVGIYGRVLVGALAGCGLIAFAIREPWVVPTALIVIATIIGLMAWLEENPVGMTGAISICLLGAGTSIAAYADQAVISYGLIAAMLLAVEPLMERAASEGVASEAVLDLRSDDSEDSPPLPTALSQVAASKV